MNTKSAFSQEQKVLAKKLLATRVAQMMGRKFEEDDWAFVYCHSKNIPKRGWSNLHIDIMHNGLGVEQKMLCVGESKSLMSYAGTTLMHPSATRSIRIASVDIDPNEAMHDVFHQYGALIDHRTKKVAEDSGDSAADMRTGWLIWERSLSEFLYFEQPMLKPNPEDHWAKWNETKAKGVRKSSKNLWIYEKGTDKKRFSVTTNAGVKIQPYFDVPSPNDPNLAFFRVQGEEISKDRVQIWLTPSTARELSVLLGTLDVPTLSKAIVENVVKVSTSNASTKDFIELAQPIEVTLEAYKIFVSTWEGVSDEHRVQLLIQTIRNNCI